MSRSAWSLSCVVVCGFAALSGCTDVRKPKTTVTEISGEVMEAPIERLAPLPRLPAGVMHPVYGDGSRNTGMHDSAIDAGRSTRMFGPGIDRIHQRRA